MTSRVLPGFTGHERNIVSAGDQDSLTKPISASPADDGASQGEHSEMRIQGALETHAQLAEPVVSLDAAASDQGADAPLAQVWPTVREVGPLIRVKLAGAAQRIGPRSTGRPQRDAGTTVPVSA